MVNRAVQFAPFASLRGYYDMVKARESLIEPKKELTDEQIAQLNMNFSELRKHQSITITWYRDFEYTTQTGKITYLNHENRILKLDDISIKYDDIYKVVIN